MDDEIYTEKDRLMDKYLEKKDFYMEEKFYEDVGFNASWALDLPMGDALFKLSDWYIPGDLQRYRDDSSWELENMNIINAYKRKGINYAETDVDKYTAQLKKVLLEDIRSTPMSHVSETKKDGLDRIVVLIYEAQGIWRKTAGFKYCYFFIREETGLGFFSAVYDQEIIEGSLDELVAMISEKKKVVSRFEIYSRWEWS